MLRSLILIFVVIYISNCQWEFTGLLCKNLDYSALDQCTECTRDPNKFVECAKMVMTRVADDVFNFYCFTDSDLQTGGGPTRSQQVSIYDKYQNLQLLCETSISHEKILKYVTNDACQVQRVVQPLDSDWFSDCIENQFRCGSAHFPMRYGQAYMTKIELLAVNTSNDAQNFFKYFNKCLKATIAQIYEKESGTCQDIEKLAESGYLDCFKSQDLCAIINNYQGLPGFFTKFAQLHNLDDEFVQKLLKSILFESKNCGDKSYNLLKRMWKGLVNESTLVFLMDE